jgi:hypothetical protein
LEVVNYQERFGELGTVDREFLLDFMVEVEQQTAAACEVANEEMLVTVDSMSDAPNEVTHPVVNAQQEPLQEEDSAEDELPAELVSSRGRVIIRRLLGSDWVV